jgi:hypothetical protein
MKKIILTLFAIILCALLSNESKAQYVNIFGSAKFPEYNNANIQLSYIDESPDPDLFYTNTSLNKKPYYGLGASYDNFKHEKELYYNVIGNLNFGELFGIDIGLSAGYPVWMNSKKNLTILPFVTGGVAYTNKPLGELKNNTVYIQVNSTKFADYTNVNVSLAKVDLFIKPTLNILWDINSKTQIRLTGAYLMDFNMNQFISFTGKDNSGKSISDKEDIDAKNLSYYINGQKSSSIPFNIKGLELKLGVAFNLGADKSSAVK